MELLKEIDDAIVGVNDVEPVVDRDSDDGSDGSYTYASDDEADNQLIPDTRVDPNNASQRPKSTST